MVSSCLASLSWGHAHRHSIVVFASFILYSTTTLLYNFSTVIATNDFLSGS